MDSAVLSPSYEKRLRTFRLVLRHILERGELLPACLDFDLRLIQALNDLVRAVRDSSRTSDLVREACRAFAEEARRSDVVMKESDVTASFRRASFAELSA